MIKVYSGLRGFFVFFLWLAGAFLLLSFFFWGIAKVIQFFLPLVIVIAYLLIVIFVLGILPATYIKDMRPSLIAFSMAMSQALGISTGILSFFYVINYFGFLGIISLLFFKFLAPIALAGALLRGSWHIAEHLVIWISFTYAMKYYSQRLLNGNPSERHTAAQGRIIDVDVIEVKGK